MADLGGGEQQWTTMANNGQQCATIGKNEQHWAMGNNKQKWTTMDNNGQQSVVLNASLMRFLVSAHCAQGPY